MPSYFPRWRHPGIPAMALCASGTCWGMAAEPAVIFDRDVAPILITRCLECHRAADAAGDLTLESAEGLQMGGASGAVVVSGHAGNSYLVERLEAGEMPPPKKGHTAKLSAEEISVRPCWPI